MCIQRHTFGPEPSWPKAGDFPSTTAHYLAVVTLGLLDHFNTGRVVLDTTGNRRAPQLDKIQWAARQHLARSVVRMQPPLHATVPLRLTLLAQSSCSYKPEHHTHQESLTQGDNSTSHRVHLTWSCAMLATLLPAPAPRIWWSGSAAFPAAVRRALRMMRQLQVSGNRGSASHLLRGSVSTPKATPCARVPQNDQPHPPR